MKCPKCGREVDEEDKYCPYCGSLIERRKTTKPIKLKNLVAISIILGIFIIAIIPTPHTYVSLKVMTSTYTITEPEYGYVTRTRIATYTEYVERTQTERVKWLTLSKTIPDCHYFEWNLRDLPSAALYIVVNVKATQEVRIVMEDSYGRRLDHTARNHWYHVWATGPLLYIKIQNPGILCTGSPAIVDADIKIYIVTLMTVPELRIKPEVYESYEVTGYKTHITMYKTTITYTSTEIKPWWIP